MKRSRRIAAIVLAGLFAATSSSAGAGGHGGSGGHSFGGHGGRGGHSAGHSSGSGFGHALGHSFSHLFGHHAKASSPASYPAPGLAGAVLLHGKNVPPPVVKPIFVPVPPRLHRHLFGPRFGFGNGGCEFGFPRHRFFFFGDDLNCFDGGFFGPFFLGAFSGSLIGTAAFPSTGQPSPNPAPEGSSTGPATEANLAQPSAQTGLPEKEAAGPPVTLLQLRDGMMYGLTDYWYEDGKLHYKTTYGGEDFIEMDRVDWEKTIHLNAARGVGFVLTTKPLPR